MLAIGLYRPGGWRRLGIVDSAQHAMAVTLREMRPSCCIGCVNGLACLSMRQGGAETL